MEAPVAYEVFVTKPCPVCGKDFTSYKVHNKKCCSRQCSDSKRKLVTYKVKCGWCKQPFVTRYKNRTFCCPEHYALRKSTLTEDDVKYLRSELQNRTSGWVTQMAKRFKVTVNTISCVIHERNWKNR